MACVEFSRRNLLFRVRNVVLISPFQLTEFFFLVSCLGLLRPSSSTPAKTVYRKPYSLCELKRCPPYATCFVNPISKIPLCYCPETCPFSPQIICASNRKHYINECFMRHFSCKEKRKLTVLNKGLCYPYNNLGRDDE